MASKLELLMIRGNRLQGMINDIHKDEECPENLKLYWGVYACERCKHLVETIRQDVYLKMPIHFRVYADTGWFIKRYITYPIQDLYYRIFR